VPSSQPNCGVGWTFSRHTLLLEGDLYIRESVIGEHFATVEKEDLAQPSLATDSPACHPVFSTCSQQGIGYTVRQWGRDHDATDFTPYPIEGPQGAAE